MKHLTEISITICFHGGTKDEQFSILVETPKWGRAYRLQNMTLLILREIVLLFQHLNTMNEDKLCDVGL